MVDDTTGLNTPTPTPPVGEGTPTPQPAPVAPPPAAQEAMVPLGRFESVTAQKWDAIREAERVKAELALANSELERLRAGATPTPGATPPTPASRPAAPSVSQADVDARARELLFNQRCTEVANEGKKAHQDFDAALDALRNVSPMTDGTGRPALPASLIEAAIETGLGHEVLYALGKNSAEADRIMTLPPLKQAVEVARFAEALRPRDEGAAPVRDANVSSAPPPIRPVVIGRASVSPADLALDDPNLPMAEFIKRRDAEEKARRASGRRI